ncbi:DUF1569 domain-containing protein [Marinobacter sp. SBS5]|uniref:DUF1569 domain-containing protein n=1 Tax=Marinobacter sp. SBS5 TaxID=3401754 RepID=UPI003AB05189
MNRRKLILGSIASGVFIGSGAAWLGIEQSQEPLDIDFALSNLSKLMKQNLTTTGEWSLYQVFTHCAQSVEYSMLGYPEHKSDIFKNTVGKAAFSLFSSKRKMTHALDEAIPGAPNFSNEENIADAFERFKKSLIDFKMHEGVLAPHFAYGQLTKQQYEMAHVMHFNNHLQEIEVTNVLS